MTDWQPIETAPKDGTNIIAWVTRATWDVGEDVMSMRETRRPFVCAVYWDKRSNFGDGAWRVSEDFDLMVEAEATHWTPLPDPPKE